MGKVEAIYTVSQPTVLTEAQSFKNLYAADHAAFEAKDPGVFVVTYEADFLALIVAAIATGTDESYMDTVHAETEDVEVVMEACRKYIQNTLRYWVVKKWGEGSGMFNAFGFDDYKNVDKSHEKMVSFMNNVKNLCAIHTAELLAEGMPALEIAKAPTLAGQILTEKGEQKTAIKIREEKSDIRVAAYNAVWTIMLQLNGASKMVFADDPSHMALYNMPETDSVHTFSDDILSGETDNAFERTLLPNAQLTLEAHDVNLDFGLMKLVGDVVTGGVGVNVPAGTSVTVQASALGDVTQNHFLNITNNTANDGSWKVVN